MNEDVAVIGIGVETKLVEAAVRALESLAQAGVKVESSVKVIEGATAKTVRSISDLGKGSKSAGDDMTKLARDTEKAGEAASKASKGFNEVSGGFDLLKTAVGGYLSINAVQSIVKMADSVTTLQTSLKLSALSAKEAGKAYEELFNIAQRSRTSFTDLGATYSTIARAGLELGVSQTRLLKVTEAIGNAMTIGGGSAQSMNAALVQLGQGLSSGTLRGEELNSILEQTPRLGQALAEGMGVSRGELRKLGEAGALTGKAVIDALEKSSVQLAKEVQGATLTVGQAFTNLSSSTVKFIGDADSASGASSALAKAMQSASQSIISVGKSINDNKEAFSAVATGLASAATVAGVAALAGNIGKVTAAVRLLGIAMASNPVILGLTAIAAAGGALYSLSEDAKKSAKGISFEIENLNAKIAKTQKLAAAGVDDGSLKNLGSMKSRVAALQQELAGLAAKDIDTSAEDARFARGTAAFKEREQALKSFKEAGGHYLTDAAKHQATLNKEIDTARTAFELGAISADDYSKRILAVQASFAKKGAADSVDRQGMKEASTLITEQIDKLKLAMGNADKEFANTEAITKRNEALRGYSTELESAAVQEAAMAKANAQMAIDALSAKKTRDATVNDPKSSGGAVSAAKAAYDQTVQELVVRRDLAGIAADTAKTNTDITATQKQALDIATQEKNIRSATEVRYQNELSIKRAQQQLDQTGMTMTVKQSAEIAKQIDLEAASHELRYANLEAEQALIVENNRIIASGATDTAEVTRRNVDKYQADRLAAENKYNTAVTLAGIKSQQTIRDEWKKGWEATDQIAREAFTGWAENGTSMAKAIGKALLSAIYEATIRPIAFQIYSSATGALGMSGGSGTGGTLMSGFNAASSANSAYNMANGGYAAGYANFATSSVGQSLGLGTAATEGFAYGAGADFAAAEVGGSAAGTTALGTAVGEAIPYIGWFIAAVGILSQMGPTSARSLGSSQASYGADGKLIGTEALDGLVHRPSDQVRADYAKELANPTPWQYDVGKRGPQESPNVVLERELASSLAFEKMSTGADVQAKNLAELYFNAAKTLDIKAAAASFSFASNTGQSGEHPNASFGVSIGGKSYNSGEAAFADPEVVKLSASRTILEALKASELPKYLSGVFDGLTTSTATQAQIDDTMKLATSYKTLHDQLQALPFEYLRDMSYKAAAGLVAAAGTMENLGSLLGGYYEAFYTSEEKKAQLTKNTTAAFEKLGIVMPALDESARAWYRSEVDRLGAMDMSVAANASAYTSILSLSGAMNTLVPALEDTAKTATATAESLAAANAKILKSSLDAATTGASDAMSALTRAVDAQKSQIEAAYTTQADAINASLSSVAGSIGKLQSLSDSLKSTLNGMRINGSDAQYRAAAQAQIGAALATARSGGGLPLDGQLASALATVSKPSEQLYGNFVDYARDFYKTANDISSLGDLTGQQLTADQATQAILNAQLKAAETSHTASIAALDDILSNAQLQLDAANGINSSVVSVADALLALSVSIGNLVTERTAQDLKAAGDSKAAAYFDANKDVKAAYADNSYGLGATDYANTHYGLYGATEGRTSPVASTKGKSYFELYPDVAAAFAANSYGLSQVEYSARHFANFGKDEKRTYPGFAQGINYVPNDMTARIHEGEAVVPKVYNPYNPNAQRSDDTAAALRAMADRLDRIEANTRATAGHTAGTDRKLARVIPGNALITEAA